MFKFVFKIRKKKKIFKQYFLLLFRKVKRKIGISSGMKNFGCYNYVTRNFKYITIHATTCPEWIQTFCHDFLYVSFNLYGIELQIN